VSARRAQPAATAADYDDSDGWYLDDGPVVHSKPCDICPTAPAGKGGKK
jgi:hypothetical protein